MPQMTLEQALAVAIGHHQAGRLEQAQAIYGQILSVSPTHADALHLLGVLFGQQGRTDDAVRLIRRAIAQRPEANFYTNLGKFLQDARAFEEAIAACREALRLRPALAEAENNLGNALKSVGRLEEAVACYRRALELKPAYAEAHNNLGNALKLQGRLSDALASFRQALAARPQYPEALSNLANTLTASGRFEDAAAAAREAVRLRPGFAEACGNLANALRELRAYDESVAAYREALALRPDDAVVHSNLLLALNYHPASTRRALFEEAAAWARRHAPDRDAAPHSNDRSPQRRLRIGYVSADFRTHASANFLIPLLGSHDRARFEIFCYAQVAAPDALTQRFQSLADAWRSTVGLDDDAFARQVREDKVDILIDLKAHTGDHRLQVFARRAAPVQVTWLGYPGTTGLASIGYRFTDPHLDPPPPSPDAPATQRYSSERLVHLETFWCYDPLIDPAELPPAPPPFALRGQVTFGSLNNFCKMNDTVLRLWARLLKVVPNSRLQLLAADGLGPARAVFESAGISADRITFLAPRPRRQYLELYRDIDIALDTFPYNGHTTSLDALWMGVPVVTLAGSTAVGRGGVSQLMNLGEPGLIAQTPDDYVRIAAELAADPARLTDLHLTLRQRMEASPLMDAPRFARTVESAYRSLWTQYCGTAGSGGGGAGA